MVSFRTAQRLSAAALNSIGRPIVGDWLAADASATSAGTELLVCTTPSFTPRANTIYLVDFVFRFAANANAAADIYFTRVKDTNLAGTERAAARQVDFGSSTSPCQGVDTQYIFDSGATPSARVFASSVIRNTGDGSLTPLASTSLIVYLLGTSTEFI